MLPVCHTAGDNFKTIHALQTSKSYSVHSKMELTRCAQIRSIVRNLLPFDIFYLVQSSHLLQVINNNFALHRLDQKCLMTRLGLYQWALWRSLQKVNVENVEMWWWRGLNVRVEGGRLGMNV